MVSIFCSTDLPTWGLRSVRTSRDSRAYAIYGPTPAFQAYQLHSFQSALRFGFRTSSTYCLAASFASALNFHLMESSFSCFLRGRG